MLLIGFFDVTTGVYLFGSLQCAGSSHIQNTIAVDSIVMMTNEVIREDFVARENAPYQAEYDCLRTASLSSGRAEIIAVQSGFIL